MVYFYVHGVKTEYTGARSNDQLVGFADKASGLDVSPSSSPAWLTGPFQEHATNRRARAIHCRARESSRLRLAPRRVQPTHCGRSPLFASLGVLTTPAQNNIAKTSQFLLGSSYVYATTAR